MADVGVFDDVVHALAGFQADLAFHDLPLRALHQLHQR